MRCAPGVLAVLIFSSLPARAGAGWPLNIHPPSFENCREADVHLRDALYPDDRANAYICKKQYDLALAEINKMLDNARGSVKRSYSYKLRAEVYQKMGRADLAKKDFERSEDPRVIWGSDIYVSHPQPSNREEDAHVAVPPPPSPPSPKLPNAETVVATGTGFIINDRGNVVTNNHVVDGCSLIKFVLNGQGLVQGRLVASDTTNDLAVANFPLPRTRVASFSDTVKSRPGDDLVVFGYPLLGLLSSSGNLTRGSLTAMAGLKDDVRYMQISAPVQPGNSGGPFWIWGER